MERNLKYVSVVCVHNVGELKSTLGSLEKQQFNEKYPLHICKKREMNKSDVSDIDFTDDDDRIRHHRQYTALNVSPSLTNKEITMSSSKNTNGDDNILVSSSPIYEIVLSKTIDKSSASSVRTKLPATLTRPIIVLTRPKLSNDRKSIDIIDPSIIGNYANIATANTDNASIIIATNQLDHRSTIIDSKGNRLQRSVSLYAAETERSKSQRIEVLSFVNRRGMPTIRAKSPDNNRKISLGGGHISTKMRPPPPIPSPRLIDSAGMKTDQETITLDTTGGDDKVQVPPKRNRRLGRHHVRYGTYTAGISFDVRPIRPERPIRQASKQSLNNNEKGNRQLEIDQQSISKQIDASMAPRKRTITVRKNASFTPSSKPTVPIRIKKRSLSSNFERQNGNQKFSTDKVKYKKEKTIITKERLWSDAKTLMQMLKTGHGKYHEVMVP